VRIAVVGAGAIGGYLGARLALADEDVTFIARGANREAIGRSGFKLIEADGAERVAASAKVETIGEAGRFDVVLLAVKAQQVTALAKDVARLFGPATSVVTLQNGVPWWFFHKFGGPYDGRTVESVDPQGVIAAHIAPERIIGAVVYPAAERVAPGVVRVIEGDRFTLGEPDRTKSDRVLAVSQALARAGFRAPVSPDIRGEIWLKLWGNLVFNPVSALTHATLVDICQFAPTRTLAATMMAEAQIVAEKLGVRPRLSIERRIAGAEAVGAHKTSMLQDVEAGRPLELTALVGSVVELARMTQTPTPAIDSIYACASLLAKILDEASGRLAVQPKD
jgi:2-dehydropantoate 2-reductase